MATKSLVALSAFLAIIVAVQAAAAPSIKDKVGAVVKKCVGETKVPADKAKLAFNQDIPQSEQEKCFLDCVYRSLDITKGEKFNAEGSKKLAQVRFPKADELASANKLIDTCNKEVSAKQGEKCSLGRAVRECFVKNGKTVNFFPSAA